MSTRRIINPVTLGDIAGHLAGFQDDTLYGVGRSIYKYTGCGPWTVAVLANGQEVYYQDERAHAVTMSTRIRCIRVGSIVEGTDACVDPVEARTRKELDDAIEAVDARAREIWDETHGCTVCDAMHDGRRIRTEKAAEKAGYSVGGPVHPGCPVCKGDGVCL